MRSLSLVYNPNLGALPEEVEQVSIRNGGMCRIALPTPGLTTPCAHVPGRASHQSPFQRLRTPNKLEPSGSSLNELNDSSYPDIIP
jgi:hypothetical protein